MTVLASVIIPVRNEEADIVQCLRAVASQDIGAAALEVVVSDGRSTDRTRLILEEVAPSFGFGQFLCVDNPTGGIGAGLNRALDEVSSPYVVRVDARSRIEPHYVRTVVEELESRSKLGVVGGAQVPIDRNTGWVSSGIARSLGNRLTTGLSRYRIASDSGASDTVWMGAFRTAELRQLGGWDESLEVNEDYELCERYRTGDRTVWFCSNLRSGYVPRSDFRSLARQYYRYGRTKGRRWASGSSIGTRHLTLMAMPPASTALLVFSVRRIGFRRTLALVGGIALALDHFGASARSANPMVRLTSVAAAATFASSWWTGVVAGAALRRPCE